MSYRTIGVIDVRLNLRSALQAMQANSASAGSWSVGHLRVVSSPQQHRRTENSQILAVECREEADIVE